MDKKLPARPNLEHLRQQAKSLLARLNESDAGAAAIFADHLPTARGMSPAEVRAAGFRLADAQSAIARQSGFASWPSLARHVDQLRSLEGSWEFEALEVSGYSIPPGAFANSKMLMDGDRFRMESPEADYEGIFNIDVDQTPHLIDIEFVAGPEAGNWAHGIFDLKGDDLTICLGLTGVPRPTEFASTSDSGHALETLRRASSQRPAGVEGGTPPETTEAMEDPARFEFVESELFARLQGEWKPVEVVINGIALSEQMTGSGTRIFIGNELKVTFGGPTMIHAKVALDETTSPIAADYLDISPHGKGAVNLGILEIEGDVIRVCSAPAGAPRPTDFSAPEGGRHTFSVWQRA